MELRQLQLLLAVIESGGYAPAGKLLHLSHSAIHRQIRMLEQEFDCRLLTRSGRTMQPTESGRTLAELMLRVRQEVADVRRQVNDLNDLRTGRLRIGSSSGVLVAFLPAVLQRFSKRFPGVRLHLITGVAVDLIEDVSKGNLDVAIVFDPADLLPPMPKLDHEILYREEFDWAVGKAHPLAQRSRVSLAELAEYPLITLPPRSHLRRTCDRLFTAKGIATRVITEVDNEEVIDKLLETNIGFALRRRGRPVSPKIRCFRVANRTVRCDVGMVWQARSYVPRAVQEFVGMCRESASPSAAPLRA